MHSEKKRWGLGFVSAMGLALSLMPGGSGCGTLETEDPPLVPIDPVVSAEEAVPNEYIFVYRDEVTDSDKQNTERLLKEYGGTKHHDYEPLLKGFSAELPPDGLVVMRRNPAIAAIHRNYILHATSIESGVQTCPSWGLDVLDQAQSLEPNGVYTYAGTGTDVHVYVLDSGIDSGHAEFKDASGNSRVTGGRNFIAEPNGPLNPDDVHDCQGHGTHLAGVVGGKTFGVAKNVTFHPVRVAGCNGGCNQPTAELADITNGFKWVNDQVIASPHKAVILIGYSMQLPTWPDLYEILNPVDQTKKSLCRDRKCRQQRALRLR